MDLITVGRQGRGRESSRRLPTLEPSAQAPSARPPGPAGFVASVPSAAPHHGLGGDRAGSPCGREA